MSDYLVTGGAGFIGSKIIYKLLGDGHSVATIDNLSTGKVEAIPAGCNVIIGNVYDNDVIERLGNKKFDAIFHIAGQSSGEISFEDPEYDLKTNTLSTLMLLKYAQKTDCKQFIYASSMSVYGEQTNPNITDATIPVPKSFYAVGKLASENYMRIFTQFGIRSTALRYYNVYGPGQNLDNLKQGMVSIYLAMAIREGHICVKGDKNRYRDFVYIDDVVDATINSLNRKGNDYEHMDIATGKITRVWEIVDMIKSHIEREVSVEYVNGTLGDQFGICGDTEKAKRLLGWKAKTGFADGLLKMIEWAKETGK